MTETSKNELIAQLKAEIHQNPDLTTMSDEQLRFLIQKNLEDKIDWARTNQPDVYRELSSLNFREKRFIANAVYESIRGLGVLGQIIADPEITEVMINGYRDIFVERSGRLQKLENHFESRQELETIITKFVSQSGRVVNESEPIVDTHLEDGSRVNVVMPPVALNGPIVTIRRFPREAMTVQKLISYGSITPEVAEVLELLVRARYNIFVSGGTGSGKTTFLNALSNFIPRDERIITIEDSAELQIKNIDNLVRLETRNAGPDGSGAITIKDLIKSALRMRPDRIVVGEVRGAEALDMLQAMNTGHDGSLTTCHANAPRDAISRLENMVLMSGIDFPVTAIREQIASAINLIIQQNRLPDGSRKIVQISEITGREKDVVLMHDIFVFKQTGYDENGKIVGEYYPTGNVPAFVEKLRQKGDLRLDMSVFVPRV